MRKSKRKKGRISIKTETNLEKAISLLLSQHVHDISPKYFMHNNPTLIRLQNTHRRRFSYKWSVNSKIHEGQTRGRPSTASIGQPRAGNSEGNGPRGGKRMGNETLETLPEDILRGRKKGKKY